MTGNDNRGWIGAALVLAAGLGFGLARWTTDDAGRADSGQAGEAHADVEAEAGGAGERITLTPAQVTAAGIEVVAVARGGGGHETRLSGRVEPAVGAHAAVAAVVGGRVDRVSVAPGARVRAGEALVVLVSGEAATLRADADAADAAAMAARQGLLRDQALVAQGVVARQELEASRARSLAADAAARAAQARLVAAGRPDSQGRVAITSPLAGVVGGVQVSPGAVVVAGDRVATVSDADRTELVFTAAPALATQVRPGMRIDVDGTAGTFPAIVLGVAAELRGQQGVAVIRARAADTDQRLPVAGAPVTGRVIAGADDAALTVPADALQSLDGRAVVFVAEDGGFRVAPVLGARPAGGRVEIVQGLRGDERIAATNAFLLKAEFAKGEAGHGH